MTQEYIPEQILYNTPYQQRVLQQDTQDSKVYLSRVSNNILNAIGNDVVLNGLQIQKIEVLNNTIVQITISPGLLIQDSTLINISEASVLNIDVRPYNQNNGYLIIYTDFQYLNTLDPNDLKLHLQYITSDGEHIASETGVWNPNINRILLGLFSFKKVPTLTVSQLSDISFTIFNKSYSYLGQTNFTNYSDKLSNHAVNGSVYGYATTELAGHVRVGDNINITEGTISVPLASESTKGVVSFATDEDALLLQDDKLALSPKNLKNLILNLKNIQIQVTDPGITLGTAMILS